MDYKNDLGVPDWRDGSAYPDPVATSARQWQWEFLRRRPDYREEWVKTYDAAQADLDGLKIGCGIKNESHRQQLRSLGLYKASYRWRFRIVMSMGGALLSATTDVFFAPSGGEYSFWSPRDPDALPPWFGDDGKVKQVAFDLRRPLGPQIARATSYLKRIQQEYFGDVTTRTHPEKWPRYLRVIDARDANTTWQAIYSEMNEDRLTDDLPPEEFDRRIDNDGAAKARQVWEQARDLMFKLTG